MIVEIDIISAIEAGKTEPWLHPEQETKWMQGRKILVHLTETRRLAGCELWLHPERWIQSCADLSELKIIQAEGVEFFRKYFVRKAIFGWRSVRLPYVPYIIEIDGKVVLHWRPLGNSWDAGDPALRRK